MDSRQQFEESPRFKGMDFTRSVTHPDYYESSYANGAWDGWQASRESLAVELPENYPFNKQPKYESDRAQTIRECREAIEAQGIRTK